MPQETSLTVELIPRKNYRVVYEVIGDIVRIVALVMPRRGPPETR